MSSFRPRMKCLRGWIISYHQTGLLGSLDGEWERHKNYYFYDYDYENKMRSTINVQIKSIISKTAQKQNKNLIQFNLLYSMLSAYRPLGNPFSNNPSWLTRRYNFLKLGRAAVLIHTIKSSFCRPLLFSSLVSSSHKFFLHAIGRALSWRTVNLILRIN